MLQSEIDSLRDEYKSVYGRDKTVVTYLLNEIERLIADKSSGETVARVARVDSRNGGAESTMTTPGLDLTAAVEAACVAAHPLWSLWNQDNAEELREDMQVYLEGALPVLISQIGGGIADAILAEFEEWCKLGPAPITDFPLHSQAWLVQRSYESTAGIARNYGEDKS